MSALSIKPSIKRRGSKSRSEREIRRRGGTTDKEKNQLSLSSKKKISSIERTAFYYGFKTIPPPKVTKEDLALARQLTFSESKTRSTPSNKDECFISVCPEEKIALLRMYENGNFMSLPQPAMLFFENEYDKKHSQEKGAGQTRFELEIIGTAKSVAEAIIIQTAMAILRDEGYQNLYVEVNSIGDKDSIAKFTKDLAGFYRKQLSELPVHCQTTFKNEVFDLFLCQNEKCREIQTKAPQSISFLSEQSRIHFREVLEYLETLNLPYRIKNSLVGNRHFSSHTVFEIRSIDSKDDKKDDEGAPLAIGFRYNTLSKRMGLKRELPAVGISIVCKTKKYTSSSSRSGNIKPKIYFIQLGFDAKLQSLKVIETLREANIPIYQSLSKDKLAAQISTAEHMKVPYVLIMGQKEAKENSVIVRNMMTRSQETVPLKELPAYLKHIKGHL